MAGSTPPAQAHERFWSPAFLTAFGLGLAFKLWLIADDKRSAIYAPHDDFNFVEHARTILDGQWFGSYDQFTLIKGPFYPLFIALASDLSVPLRIAEMLLHALACVVAVWAVAPAVRPAIVRIGIFALLLFDPYTYESTTARVIRGDVMEALALLVVALTVGIVLRRERDVTSMVPPSAALGLALAAFLLTREEGPWLYPFLVPLAVVYLLAGAPRSWRAFGKRSVPIVTAAGVAGTCWAAAAAENLSVYGWFTTTELTSPEFTSAYGALARIVPPPPKNGRRVDPRIPIQLPALEPVYRVSPAARELQPYFDGAPGRALTRQSCEVLKICGGIAGGWFVWFFRDAVALAGHYSSGVQARHYYLTLAEEIDAACERKALQCTANRHTLAPKVPLSAAPFILGDALRAAMNLARFDWLTFDDAAATTAPVVDLFRSTVDDRLSVDVTDPADHALKRRDQRAIASVYRKIVPPLTALSFVALGVRLVASIRRRRFDPIAAIALSCLAAAATLLLLLATIEELSFPALSFEYWKPLYPMTLFGNVLVLSADAASLLPASVSRRLARLERPITLSPAALTAVVACLLAFAGWRALAAIDVRAYAAGAAVTPGIAATPQPRIFDKTRLDALAQRQPATTASFDGALVEIHGAWHVQSLPTLAVKKGATLKLVGWAADPATHLPSRGLMLIVDRVRRIDITNEYGADREDVAAAFHNPAMRSTGYAALLPTSALAIGNHTVQLGIVTYDQSGYYPAASISFIVR